MGEERILHSHYRPGGNYFVLDLESDKDTGICVNALGGRAGSKGANRYSVSGMRSFRPLFG